jgi:glycosyltransferase involved in cell wall biosynthesis
MMSILVARARRQAAAVAYRQAAAIVCNSSANARQIRDLIGRNAPQVFCIYNPVDSVGIQRRFAYRDRRVWVNGRPLITAHGRLDIRQKGWDTLLRAFAVVQGKCRDARLRIVGGGRDERRLRDLAMALGVAESVEMIGHFDDPLPLVEEGDIYVLPSRFEGFPNSLLEAMAAGLPVIAADCKTGPREVIGDDEYGMLFPVDDVHALANGIEFLLESGHVRSTLAERGRERARDFALEEAIEGFREVIGSCVYGAGTVRCVG